MGKTATGEAQSSSSKDNDVIKHMLWLRSEVERIKKEYDEKVAPLQAKLKKGEAYLLARLDELGHNSIPVDAGTAFTKQLVRASVKDKSAFRDFVQQSGELDLMEVRVSSTALKVWVDANDGEVPPGVSMTTVRSLNIRAK